MDLSVLGTWTACSFFFSGRKSKLLGIAILVAALSCAAAAISRLGLFASLIVLAGTIILSRGGPWIIALFVALVLPVWPILSFDAITDGEPGLATETFRRHSKADSMEQRIQMYIDHFFGALEVAPFGLGLGRCQTCETQSAGGAGELPKEALFEMEYGRIIVEVGFVGLLGVLIIRMAFLLEVWQAFIRERFQPHSLFPNLQATSLLTLGFFFVGNLLVFNHVGCFYAWTVGVMVLATFEVEAGRIRPSSRNALRRVPSLYSTMSDPVSELRPGFETEA